MAAGKWKVYDGAKDNLCQSNMSVTGVLKCALFTSASNANTLSFDQYSDLTNEVAGAFGYTTGGATLDGSLIDLGSGVFKFTTDDAFWLAAGGDITAKYAVIYYPGGGNVLLCVCVLDSVGLTATSGEELRITMNASGVFTLSGAITD